MILSVLSSLALVSGLMVVRAKNPVHSVSFPILVFRDTSGLLLPLEKISQYERAIPSSVKPELLQSLLEKGGLTNERKSPLKRLRGS